MQALGYHHLGHLYTADHRVAEEQALKERALTCKGIPGLRAWLARHNAVLVPLLRVPTPRWQAAPKDWIPGVVPAYSADAVIGGRVAKTTKEETMYHKGCAVKVSTAMKDTMEAVHWAPELQVWRATFAPIVNKPPSAARTARRWSAPAPPSLGDGPRAHADGGPTAERVEAHSPAPAHPEGPPGGDATWCR